MVALYGWWWCHWDGGTVRMMMMLLHSVLWLTAARMAEQDVRWTAAARVQRRVDRLQSGDPLRQPHGLSASSTRRHQEDPWTCDRSGGREPQQHDHQQVRYNCSSGVPTSHHSHTLSVPLVSSYVAALHVLISPWTTVRHSGLVWLLCQGAGTAKQVDLVKLGFRQLNLMLLDLTLVSQLPVASCIVL